MQKNRDCKSRQAKQRGIKCKTGEDSDNGICILLRNYNETHTNTHRITYKCSKVNSAAAFLLKQNLGSHVISYLLSSLFQLYSHFFALMIMQNMEMKKNTLHLNEKLRCKWNQTNTISRVIQLAWNTFHICHNARGKNLFCRTKFLPRFQMKLKSFTVMMLLFVFWSLSRCRHTQQPYANYF